VASATVVEARNWQGTKSRTIHPEIPTRSPFEPIEEGGEGGLAPLSVLPEKCHDRPVEARPCVVNRRKSERETAIKPANDNKDSRLERFSMPR
jgi:hypothetical protein